MVSGPRTDAGTLTYSPGVIKTIQSIKEIVGDHSDADIYVTLKETNMDPNETAQKLLNQDPFHEVKRKRDKKKEPNQILVQKSAVEPRKQTEHVGQGSRFRSFSDRNLRRRGYSRNVLPDAGVSREFRVVRDNRVNQNANRDAKPVSVQSPASANDQVNFDKSSSTGTSRSQHYSSRSSNGPASAHRRNPQIANPIKTDGRVVSEETQPKEPIIVSRVQTAKPNDHQSNPPIVSPSGSVVGLYSSSSDPVHVPSPSATVGAIRREVGAVGVRRQSSENSTKHHHSVPANNTVSNSLMGRDGSSAETFRPFTAVSKNNQPSQTNVTEPVVASVSDRTFVGNTHQYGSRVHQQPAGHQRANQPNKEWKPKSSQKPSLNNNPGVIGTPAKSVSPPADSNSEDLESQLQEKLSRVNIYENHNVIIAQHIRVPESDRCRLTFGSFGADFDSSRNSRSVFQAVGTAEQSSQDPSASSSVSPPESSSDDNTRNKQVDLLDDQVRTSESSSPASGAVSENQSSDKKDPSTSPQNLENYADIVLVRENNPSYPAESQQHQDPRDLPTFPAYDPQTGYDIPYFRPTMDENIRGHGLPSQEVLTNIIPPTTIAMIQQQQQQQQQPQPPQAVTPMYPPVHVSHFANLMPYRQFISPVYVPPMAMTGYSGNPGYPHPSNGSSYLLMPGGGSHLTASALKYGIQQFKPVPTGSPTGFGNFANPTGYAINAPGVVGNATGLEDSSRLKYKDGNLYVPNQQAETSEIWIQNPRELPSLQSNPYYNMAGQAPSHAAYLQSHTGHASFNAATAQSSHMQYPSMYHPPQGAAIASPHHMGPAMGGNVGVGVAGAAPGSQIGGYQQQPQLGHLSWPTNF